MTRQRTQFKAGQAAEQVIILVGRNEGGRIRKPITSVKIDGIPVAKVLEWLKNAIASDLSTYGTLDMKVIEAQDGKEVLPCE